MARKAKCTLDYVIGPGQCGVEVASVELALETQIVANIRVDYRRRRVERGLDVNDDGKLIIDDINRVERVLGLVAGLRNHRRDRLVERGLEPCRLLA